MCNPRTSMGSCNMFPCVINYFSQAWIGACLHSNFERAAYKLSQLQRRWHAAHNQGHAQSQCLLHLHAHARAVLWSMSCRIRSASRRMPCVGFSSNDVASIPLLQQQRYVLALLASFAGLCCGAHLSDPVHTCLAVDLSCLWPVVCNFLVSTISHIGPGSN